MILIKLARVTVFVQPFELVTLRDTLKLPDDVYTWVGFCCVLRLPSPKSHCQFEIVPLPAVLWSVKLTVSGKHPDVVEDEKLIVGCAYMVIYCVRMSVSRPAAFCTISLTVYWPGLKYVTEGVCRNEVVPFPRSQRQLVGFPVDKSVKVTTKGAHPEVGVALKFAVG